VFLAGCIATPDSAWVTQQARHLLWHLTDKPQKLGFLIHDNDAKFFAAFDSVSEGIDIVLTPFDTPKANAVAERWMRSVRQECLDHLLIVIQRDLWSVLTEYTYYYNNARPHQGRAQQSPIPLQAAQDGPIHCRDVSGGVIRDYYR
jgi:putative transposase